jgi:hypothetical protein
VDTAAQTTVENWESMRDLAAYNHECAVLLGMARRLVHAIEFSALHMNSPRIIGLRRLVFHDISGFGVQALGGGIDPFEIASLYRGPSALPQELPQYTLDEGGTRLLGPGQTIDGSQDVA